MHIVFGILFILFGLFGAIAPRTAIKLDLRRIWYEKSEPHDFTVNITRFFGIIFTIIGIISCFDQTFLGRLFG